MVVCHAISVNCRCGAHECTGDIINIFNERSEKKRRKIQRYIKERFPNGGSMILDLEYYKLEKARLIKRYRTKLLN